MSIHWFSLRSCSSFDSSSKWIVNNPPLQRYETEILRKNLVKIVVCIERLEFDSFRPRVMRGELYYNLEGNVIKSVNGYAPSPSAVSSCEKS